jgi:hypothetical protein
MRASARGQTSNGASKRAARSSVVNELGARRRFDGRIHWSPPCLSPPAYWSLCAWRRGSHCLPGLLVAEVRLIDYSV